MIATTILFAATTILFPHHNPLRQVHMKGMMLFTRSFLQTISRETMTATIIRIPNENRHLIMSRTMRTTLCLALHRLDELHPFLRPSRQVHSAAKIMTTVVI
jgi:hypothetical protein